LLIKTKIMIYIVVILIVIFAFTFGIQTILDPEMPGVIMFKYIIIIPIDIIIIIPFWYLAQTHAHGPKMKLFSKFFSFSKNATNTSVTLSDKKSDIKTSNQKTTDKNTNIKTNDDISSNKNTNTKNSDNISTD